MFNAIAKARAHNGMQEVRDHNIHHRTHITSSTTVVCTSVSIGIKVFPSKMFSIVWLWPSLFLP